MRWSIKDTPLNLTHYLLKCTWQVWRPLCRDPKNFSLFFWFMKEMVGLKNWFSHFWNNNNMYEYFPHRMHGRYFFYMYLLCPMAYAPVPTGLGLCHIGHGDSNAIYYKLPIKIKAKTRGKRQREKERERERKLETNFKSLGFWVFDPGPNWKRYCKKYSIQSSCHWETLWAVEHTSLMQLHYSFIHKLIQANCHQL